MARTPHTAHKTRERPTDPERRRTPPGVMKIPEPTVYITAEKSISSTV